MLIRGLVIALFTLVASIPANAGFDELARTGQWRRLLSVASRRAEQLPLRPDEAFVAAHAARMVGDRDAEVEHLRRASEGGRFAELARLQLAMAVVTDDPHGAIELAAPFLRRAPSRTMRSESVSVVVEGLGHSADDRLRASLDRSARSLPTSLRRELELALADGSADRRRLVRLLQQSTRDLVALRAARALQAEDQLSVEERWLVGKTLYRHALYTEAEGIFDDLEGVTDRAVPAWQVAFLEGRCAFRQGRWDDAITCYRAAHAGRRSSEGRADILVHIARSHELAGRLEEAVESARQAVVTRTTDDRRLFLARLRLRLDQPDKAAAGVAKVRSRSRRARGEVLIALYDLREGRQQAARVRLQRISRRPWSAPAAVLAAGITFDAGDAEAAMRVLDDAAAAMRPFWADRARALMGRFPPEVVAAWRSTCAEAASSPDLRTRRRALARWAQLEIDPKQLLDIQSEVAREIGVDGRPEIPAFPPGLAADLWSVGLTDEAVRWDPAGLPRGDVSQAVWTAQQFVEQDMPWQAIPTADGAWRMAGSDIPVRGYPRILQQALYPLPDPDLVWQSAVRNQLPWAALSGVAREESRWQPTVVSRVGARGLMQLMPATATAVAAANGWPIPNLDDLFNAEVSLDLGGSEIGRLLSVFDGRLAPAVAAYNAGEAQADIWLDQCGTPCPPEVFVANITFSATSSYTQDVLTASDVYVDLYGSVPNAVSERVVGGSGASSGRATSSGR